MTFLRIDQKYLTGLPKQVLLTKTDGVIKQEVSLNALLKNCSIKTIDIVSIFASRDSHAQSALG